MGNTNGDRDKKSDNQNKNYDVINTNQVKSITDTENHIKENEKINSINVINVINVIYLDDNLKFGSKEIITDCLKIQKKTNCSLILVNDLNNLTLLFEYLLKNKTKSKFIFVVNGGMSKDSVKLIKSKNDYQSLFIGGCIYTMNLEKYSKVKQENSDFIFDICINLSSVIEFIKKTAENSKIENQKYYINSLINLYTYKDNYFKLHKELSKLYGDESFNSYINNYKQITHFLPQELSELKKEQIPSCFDTFKEIIEKNYEKIIICYLKDDYLSEYLNSILKTKNIYNYEKISYFVGNLIHSLVQYGEKRGRAIDYAMTFYKGMQLNIIDLMEFLKNRHLLITFEYFLSISSNKELAELLSKRKMEIEERKQKQFYSVILKVDYLYDDGYKPSIIDLRDLLPYPNDENYIILPFTFYTLKKIEIDSDKYLADIELEIIGKDEILENQIKNDDKKVLDYDKKNHIMILK